MEKTEKQIETAVSKYASKLGWWVLKMNSETTRGLPDRQFLRDGGEVVFVEFKRPSGRLSTLQVKRIEKLNRMGFEAVTIWDIEEGKRFFDSLERE